MSLRDFRGTTAFLLLSLVHGCAGANQSVSATAAQRVQASQPQSEDKARQDSVDETVRLALPDRHDQKERIRPGNPLTAKPQTFPVAFDTSIAQVQTPVGSGTVALTPVPPATPDPDVLTDMGILALQKGDLAAAEKSLRGALEVDPNHPRATLYLAQTLSRQGRQEEHAGQIGTAPPAVVSSSNLAPPQASVDKPLALPPESPTTPAAINSVKVTAVDKPLALPPESPTTSAAINSVKVTAVDKPLALPPGSLSQTGRIQEGKAAAETVKPVLTARQQPRPPAPEPITERAPQTTTNDPGLPLRCELSEAMLPPQKPVGQGNFTTPPPATKEVIEPAEPSRPPASKSSTIVDLPPIGSSSTRLEPAAPRWPSAYVTSKRQPSILSPLPAAAATPPVLAKHDTERQPAANVPPAQSVPEQVAVGSSIKPPTEPTARILVEKLRTPGGEKEPTRAAPLPQVTVEPQVVKVEEKSPIASSTVAPPISPIKPALVARDADPIVFPPLSAAPLAPAPTPAPVAAPITNTPKPPSAPIAVPPVTIAPSPTVLPAPIVSTAMILPPPVTIGPELPPAPATPDSLVPVTSPTLLAVPPLVAETGPILPPPSVEAPIVKTVAATSPVIAAPIIRTSATEPAPRAPSLHRVESVLLYPVPPPAPAASGVRPVSSAAPATSGVRPVRVIITDVRAE